MSDTRDAGERELAPGLFVRGIAVPLRLADFGLAVFDMDSTLISIECVDEIAAVVGKKAEVAAITEAAMRGEIADYKESLRRRVALLRGVPVSALQTAEANLKAIQAQVQQQVVQLHYFTVTAPTAGNPDIKVFDGQHIQSVDQMVNPTGASLLAGWFAYGLNFNVGATVAIGDVQGTGVPEIVTGSRQCRYSSAAPTVHHASIARRKNRDRCSSGSLRKSKRAMCPPH